MFTPQERGALLAELVSAAKLDPRIVGAALVGSSAQSREDQWSDIDLALGLDRGVVTSDIAAEWTHRMYRDHGAVAHLDAWYKTTLFRVFLLSSTLQVDISFRADSNFGAYGPNFELLFGTANEIQWTAPPASSDLIGWCWVYGLHVRSSIARGRVWQAEHMLSAMRTQLFALACVRHNLPTAEGRGIDRLPATAIAPIEGTLISSLEVKELRRALAVSCEALLLEVEHVDVELAGRIAPTIRALATTAINPGQ